MDDAVCLKCSDRDEDEHTHLANSQYVVSLHHDSKGKILHLHINANRIDMEGNTNNEYMIGKRATMAANKVNEQRGWIQSMTKREWNIDKITNACIEALKSMDSFDFNAYEAKLKTRSYGVKVMRDSIGKVCGYSEVDSIREQLTPTVAKLKLVMDRVKETYAEKKRR